MFIITYKYLLGLVVDKGVSMARDSVYSMELEKWKQKNERGYRKKTRATTKVLIKGVEPMFLQKELADITEQIRLLSDRKRQILKLLKQKGHKTLKQEYMEKPIYLYVLSLQGGFYYIGMSRNVEARFKKHLKGKGANWTRRYKPIAVIKTINTELTNDAEAALLEDKLTLEYAETYGTDKVRGGGYCQAKPVWPQHLIF